MRRGLIEDGGWHQFFEGERVGELGHARGGRVAVVIAALISGVRRVGESRLLRSGRGSGGVIGEDLGGRAFGQQLGLGQARVENLGLWQVEFVAHGRRSWAASWAAGWASTWVQYNAVVN